MGGTGRGGRSLSVRSQGHYNVIPFRVPTATGSPPGRFYMVPRSLLVLGVLSVGCAVRVHSHSYHLHNGGSSCYMELTVFCPLHVPVTSPGSLCVAADWGLRAGLGVGGWSR
ncbi:hypothetical protein GDO86_009878 [Hymenochirus boettgeri]|uniref:Uncharacterized protein n=1 Tax=Hymenochirus boettgeri TaxID=247094 RepID=A0A8T2JN84_9PIPI|nr:hypothetical protein GDO86_009878 [Hymenochirus boettgeri]